MKNKFVSALNRYVGVGFIALRETYRLAPGLTVLLVFSAIIIPLLEVTLAVSVAGMSNKVQESAKTKDLHSAINYLWLFAVAMITVTVIGSLTGTLRTLWKARVRQENDMRVTTKRHSLDLGRLKSPAFETLVRRINEAPSGWNPAMAITLEQFELMRAIVSVITSIGIISSFSVPLAFLLITFVIPEFCTDVYLGRIIREKIVEWAEKSKPRNEARICFYRNVPLVETKLFSSAKLLWKMVHDHNTLIYTDMFRIEKKRILLGVSAKIMSMLGLSWCMLSVLRASLDQQIGIGTMGLLFAGLTQLRGNTTSAFNRMASQVDSSRYFADLQEFYRTEPLLPVDPDPIRLNLHEPPTIEFQNVSFRYENQDVFAVSNLSLVIMPGDKIGIFGENGSGKSTLISLLCRVYDPTEGRILINGVDLRRIDPADWYSTLSVLMQRHHSYGFTIRSVISLGDIDKTPTDEELQRASQFANAYQVIEKLPKGFDTQLGQEHSGVDLSGGQAKRVAIAQRMFRNRHVQIFDEPEKELDSSSRTKFFEQLREQSGSVTAIFVSHNMATLQLAERAVVMQEGKLVDQGSHDHLLKKGGPYADAYKNEVDALTHQAENLRSFSLGTSAV